MVVSNIQTPGVYINEVNGFGNSVVPVATAIPAFIGYTPQAVYQGKSYLNLPFKVTSFAEFQAIYCLQPPATAPAPAPKQYSPEYYLIKQKALPAKGSYMMIDGAYYSIVPDASTIYYLYNSVQMYFQNGGGACYIVSVGPYGTPSKKPINPGDALINPNVVLSDLKGGLALLANEQEPTMYICPEATLLSLGDNQTLMAAMLLQSSTMQTSVCIFDIIGGNAPDPISYTVDIQNFRNSTGSIGLDYGAAYYPFIGTTVMQNSDIDYTNLFGGDVTQLAPLLSPADNPDPVTAAILSNIQKPASPPLTVLQNNNALLIASKTYTQLIQLVLVNANILPPSGAVAGVIATTDSQNGVWQAPANTTLGAVSLPIKLSETQQAALNVDAVSGKSINAIRFFSGLGIMIWGARTLDGNSQDWRYLSVRRTMIMLEQSCKLAAHAYVFQPNVKNTWEAIKSMISSFLTTIWKEGGLMGATPAAAFSVDCGLGTTMTADDVLNGFLNVTVKVCAVRPAEFIVITFQQIQATSS